MKMPIIALSRAAFGGCLALAGAFPAGLFEAPSLSKKLILTPADKCSRNYGGPDRTRICDLYRVKVAL
jgi:hypothetical protein